MTITDEYLPNSGAGREELRCLYTWTIEEAVKAQEEWAKTEHPPFAKEPVFRCVAAHELKDIGDAFIATKDMTKILEALFLCAMNDLPIPKWCSFAYIEAYRDVWFRAATSWDTVFGKPHPKGTHSADFRQFRRDAFRVADYIDRVKIDSPETPLDNEFFDNVGKKFGVGARTKVLELYKHATSWKKIFIY